MMRRATRFRRGQALLEYVIAVFFVAIAAGVLWHVVSAAEKSSDRAKALVSTDYP